MTSNTICSSTVVSFLVGIPKKEYEEQQAVNEKYFKEDEKCRGLLKATKWSEAEQICKAAVPLAQQRYGEALEYYGHAFEFAQSSLKETDAELAAVQ